MSQTEIEAAISRNEPDKLLIAVLSAALYAEDALWAEDVCVRLAAHEHWNVRGNAILGFSHIARIHRKLTKHKVMPIIENALSDENEYVKDHAESAAEDVEIFLHWRRIRHG